ncbi:MAG TPA: type II toxin-antitoxin system Y4mF family antitoxin [Chlamydiales bacterium]|jgi:y4mF family transcriptional regulator|nr:type II toxin-antitoxin system Y4mF family antitoxin [Chlamydiales bacterium]
MDGLSKKIGRMVRFHRKKAELTQKELATLADIGKTAVFDIEKGKPTVRLATLLAVLHVLNIQLGFQGPLMDDFEGSDEKS